MRHELNENGISFQASLHHQSQEKYVLNPIWIREKGRRLIKIEDTHQEEEVNPLRNNDYLRGQLNDTEDPLGFG